MESYCMDAAYIQQTQLYLATTPTLCNHYNTHELRAIPARFNYRKSERIAARSVNMANLIEVFILEFVTLRIQELKQLS
jgi:hypothetical protein